MDVGEAAKGEEEGARDEREDARGPGLGALGDVEGLGDVGQDDVEARDEKLLGGLSVYVFFLVSGPKERVRLTAMNMDTSKELQNSTS